MPYAQRRAATIKTAPRGRARELEAAEDEADIAGDVKVVGLPPNGL